MAHPDVHSEPQLAQEYLRVSYDRSGRERSNDEQHADNERVAEREGWTFGEPYRDKGSASRFATKRRDDFDRLVADLEADRFKGDILVLWESSRGSRRLSEWALFLELLEKRGVRVHVTSHGRTYDMANPRDRRTLQEDGTDAEYESGKISARVKRSTAASAADGRPHGRRLYGYKRVYDAGRRGALVGQEIEPDEAAVVRRIYRDYLAGTGYSAIAQALTAEGVPPPAAPTTEGAKPRWWPQRVRAVLTNPAYVGQRLHHGETAKDGAWPALVDQDAFDRAQARLDSRKGVRQTATARLLTGVARCGVCDGKTRAHNGPDGWTYTCREGYHVKRSLTRLDDYVTGWLLRRLADPQAAAALDGAPDPRVEAARARKAELVGELEEAKRLRRGEVPGVSLSITQYAEEETRLLPLIAEAEREARRAAIPISVDVPEDPARLEAWWYDELTAEQRREVVAAYVAAVVIEPVGKGQYRNLDMASCTTIERRR